MAGVYDNWERLVRATLRREELYLIAQRSSNSLSFASSSSFDFSGPLLPEGDHQHIDWDRVLPLDYKKIISKSVTPVNYSTKKELFFHLCNHPILLYGGKLSFWLSKEGKKCYMLRARELSISFEENPGYWNWKSSSESRFSEAAELLEESWLIFRGKIKAQILSQNTTYAVYLVFAIADSSIVLDSKDSARFAHWSSDDIAESLKTPMRCIHRVKERWRPAPRCIGCQLPQRRRDGWMEIYLEQFYSDQGDKNNNIAIQVCESKILYWKKGLIIEGIEFRPKEIT